MKFSESHLSGFATTQELRSISDKSAVVPRSLCDIYGLMEPAQHFFLSAAGESIELAQPWECWEIRRLWVGARDDYMLISVEPPYLQPFGIGYRDVYKLIIAARLNGCSLYPIKSWPCHVSVFLAAAEDIVAGPEVTPDRVSNVAWAMLFRTLADAETYSKKLS